MSGEFGEYWERQRSEWQKWYAPGEAWLTSVAWKLADGRTLEMRERLIVWSREVLGPWERTGEPIFRLLVTLAEHPDDAGDEISAAGEPFVIDQVSGGWRSVPWEGDGLRAEAVTPAVTTYPWGQLDRRVGVYVPRDRRSNSVAIMAESYTKRVRELALWRAEHAAAG